MYKIMSHCAFSFYHTYFFQNFLESYYTFTFFKHNNFKLTYLISIMSFCVHCFSKLKFQYVCFVRCGKEALRMLLLFLDVKNQISTQQFRRLQCCFNIHYVQLDQDLLSHRKKVDIYKSLTSDFDLTFFSITFCRFLLK